MSIPQNLNHHHSSGFACRNTSQRCNHHTLTLSAIANLHHNPGNHSKRAYQGMHQGIRSLQGMIVTPTANRIAPIITNIPRLIRNIRHHNPQANFQVGFTSLSICFFSFFVFPGSKLLNWLNSFCGPFKFIVIITLARCQYGKGNRLLNHSW